MVLFLFQKMNGGNKMSEELMKELEKLDGIVDTEPLFVMAYHEFIRAQGFTPNEKMVFLCLKTYAGDKSKCFPGQKRIADDLGISTRTVLTVLKSLENKGALLIINQTDDDSKRKTANLYVLASFDVNSKTFNSKSLEKYKEIQKRAKHKPTKTS